MEIPITNAIEFQHLIEALSNELVEANIHFKLYNELTDSIGDYEREYNQSRVFWSLTFKAHLDSAIIRLSKIYDQNSNSLNLRNLLDTIKANISIFDTDNFHQRLKDSPFVESLSAESRKPDESQLEQDIRYASNRNELVSNLTIWRNNFYAHRGASIITKQINLTEKYPLTYVNVEELLTNGMKILNRYTRLFKAVTYSTIVAGHDDYLIVLDSMREKLKQIHKQVEQERIQTNQK